MLLIATSHGNPDRGQDVSRTVAPDLRVQVFDFAAASAVYREWIERNDLGSGNVADGIISVGGQRVGRVSYNGKVWPAEEWSRNQKPIFNPYA